jgi:hypothetical protein
MKKRLLVAFVVTAVSAAGWAIWVNACDRDKQASASNASTAGHEGCAMKAGAGTACEGHGTSAASMKSASGGCPMMKGASATTASMNGAKDGCSMKSGAASASMTAGHDCCAGKSMKGAAATTAANMGGACDPRMMGAGMIGAPNCAGRGTAASTAEMEGMCDACAEMISCGSQLTSNGVQTQVVPLKNGVMFVYTTDTAAHVRAVQNALARRNDHLNVLAQSGDHAKLCPECRTARGAIASGKLVRETVNIEGGCMTLVTSSDPALVTKLRAMAAMGNGRIKS